MDFLFALFCGLFVATTLIGLVISRRRHSYLRSRQNAFQAFRSHVQKGENVEARLLLHEFESDNEFVDAAMAMEGVHSRLYRPMPTSTGGAVSGDTGNGNTGSGDTGTGDTEPIPAI